jgi:hypothetical protein
MATAVKMIYSASPQTVINTSTDIAAGNFSATSGVMTRAPVTQGLRGTLSPPTLAAGPGYVPSQMAELRNADFINPSFPKNPRIPDRKTLRSAGLAGLG